MSAEGAALFARFAHPPHALGYCGPQEGGAVLGVDPAGPAEAVLERHARAFDGAWPYLELIAATAGLDDPLDPRVVEAYWLGNGLASQVTAPAFECHLAARIGGRTGADWAPVAAAIGSGGRPTHAFHVFSVYPWVALLRRGVVAEALRVLDRCRIRWGRVVAVEGGRAQVRTRPVIWRDGRLGLGDPRVEQATLARDGLALMGACAPGDRVALHWDWVCAPLDRVGMAGLRAATHHQLELVNRDVAPGGTVVVRGGA